jgi:pimeloyl-ACP methyl ester carboxylesterase
MRADRPYRPQFSQIGLGTPVLFLHGYPEHSGIWRPLAESLSHSYCAVMPDLPGFAGSGGVEDPSARGIAAHMLRLMADLGHTRFVIVAHDIGGAVGWQLALDYPERIMACIMISAPHPADLLACLWRDMPECRLPYLDRMTDVSVAPRLDPVGLSRLVYPEAGEAIKALQGALEISDPYQIAAFYRVNLGPTAQSRWDKYAPCAVPLLAIFGADDPFIPVAAYQQIRRRLCGPFRVDVLPRQGHFLPQRVPRLLARRVHEWLTRRHLDGPSTIGELL